MSEEVAVPEELSPEPTPSPAGRDPADTLNIALLVYILVNSLFGLPLLLFPRQFYDFAGAGNDEVVNFGGLRWIGAVLVAWTISAILVLARPGGKAIFVTTGALQMTFAAVAVLYSWSIDDYLGDLWFQAVSALLLVGAAIVLWWARLKARKLLAGAA